jgi:hypothetical protein
LLPGRSTAWVEVAMRSTTQYRSASGLSVA